MVDGKIDKTCLKCKETKPLVEFGTSHKDGSKYSHCRSCRAVKRRKDYDSWRIKHPKLPPREAIIGPNGRLCRTCGLRKTPEEFRRDKRSRDNLSWACRDCSRINEARWCTNNIDRKRDNARAASRRRREKEPERDREILRRSRLRTKYGIEFEDFLAMLDLQDWQCQICDKKLAVRIAGKRKGNVACIDHDHETNKIRGILCSHCNRGIGLLGDNPLKLEKAAVYIRRHQK